MTTTLKKYIDFLQDRIDVCTDHADGRINSIQDEAAIIDALKVEFPSEIKEAPPRHWYDFRAVETPVQIKVSTMKCADNFSSKQAIVYALTNSSEKECGAIHSWNDFHEVLKNSELSDRDYNVIVLNKKTKRIHHYTLQSLSELVPNGSNLPFQINWNKQTYVKRTPEEAYRFIIDAYKRSVSFKINAHQGYEQL